MSPSSPLRFRWKDGRIDDGQQPLPTSCQTSRKSSVPTPSHPYLLCPPSQWPPRYTKPPWKLLERTPSFQTHFCSTRQSPTHCPGPLKPGAKDPPAGAPGSLGHRPPLVGGVETWRRRRDRDTSTEAGRGRGPLLLRSSGLELREGQRTIFSTTVLGVSARPCHLRVAGAPEGPLRGGAGQLPGPRLPERQS